MSQQLLEVRETQSQGRSIDIRIFQSLRDPERLTLDDPESEFTIVTRRYISFRIIGSNHRHQIHLTSIWLTSVRSRHPERPTEERRS